MAFCERGKHIKMKKKLAPVSYTHLARALAGDASIYIFDDSFSALDFKTDATLRKAIKENTKDATVIIVAQRINTIMDADNILDVYKRQFHKRAAFVIFFELHHL